MGTPEEPRQAETDDLVLEAETVKDLDVGDEAADQLRGGFSSHPTLQVTEE